MKTAILTKFALASAVLYLVCPGVSWAEVPRYDITIGRTIHTDKPVCLVYRDDGFWVTGNVTEDTLRHYSTDGTLLAEYQLPGSVQRYGVTWDGAHWWIGDNNYGSETIYKCELNEAEKRLDPVRAYAWPHLGPSGLEWAQGYLWVSDDATDIIYRVSVGDTSFTAIEPWCSTNPEPWDLAWDGTNIWSITGPGGGFDSVMGEREIYKHDAAGNIIEIWHYPPSDDPGQGSYGGFGTGLAFAGSQLWYCDLDRNEIVEGIREAGIGWIAFGSNRDGDDDIWAVRADGTGLRQLTNMPGSQSSPQWSADSAKIVYTSGTQIWVYDWFTGTNTKIYDTHDYEGRDLGSYAVDWPTWSPDGSRILYAEEFSYNDPHIMVINADGTGREVVPVQSGFVTIPSWSPTGTAFVYNRRNSGASFSEDLWIYDFTATGNIMNGVNHRLTDGASAESTIKYYVDWTPGGDMVLVWGHNLVILDPGQSPHWNGPISNPSDPHVTFLTDDAGLPSPRYLWPRWSPDLSQIAYGYYTGTSWDLWIMDSSGRNRYPLVTASYQEACPDWGNPQPGIPTQPPIAEAGDDILAGANETVTLDGSASYDPDGTIVKYTWKRLPDDVVLYSGEEPTCDTKALGRVEELIELTVTDNSSATATDTLRIISRTTEDLKNQLAAMQSQIDQAQRQNQELRALVDKIGSFPPIAQWLRRAAKLGDLNGDGRINMADFALLTKGWLR